MAGESYGMELLAEWPDQTLEDIVGAISDGATTPGEALGFSADAINAIENMALGYYRAKHYDKAGPIFGFVLRMDPNRFSAWRGLGAICQVAREYTLAVLCYSRAVNLQPEDIPSQVFWGECLCQLGERDKGLKVLNQAIEDGTKDPNMKAYVVRAQSIVGADGGLPNRIVLMKEGKALAADAREALIAEGFDPKKDEVLFDPDKDLEIDDMLANPELKGVIDDLNTHVAEGHLTYKDIGGFTDNELSGAYACACKYAEMGQVLEAIQISGYLMFLDPYDARYYQLVGICLQRMKQYEAAEHYYKMALIIDKEDVMSKVYLGETLIMAGRIDDGLGHIKQGIEVGEQNPMHQDVVDRGRVLVKQFGN